MGNFNTCVFSFIHLHTKTKWQHKLNLKDEFLLVMMRLRLGLLFEDLAYRFNIAKSTASSIFTDWINVMAVHQKFLIKWLPREIIQSNMPQLFKETYPNACCIIDCSVIFIERPPSFQERAQTYSNYKKHNTVKFLIAVTPAGTISYVSAVWGGRVSDKFLTQQSGFLKLIDPGDTILADRGFDIGDEVGLHGARLITPVFTKGKMQLSQQEVEVSQRIVRVCIHVKRVRGEMKNKYTILQGTISVNCLKHKADIELANVDKILITCAALTNLPPSVVPT